MCNNHCPERNHNECEGKSYSCKATEQNSSNECCSSGECKADEGGDNEQPKLRYSTRRLQQFAIAISVLSIFYNGAEGIVSVVFGGENGSYSLIFFGIQSFIEVVSACLVVWRFIKIAKPGEEKNKTISDELLNKERKATIAIGILFGILTIGTWATSINSLVHRNHPDSSTPSLIISASALGIMILVWLPKPYLAKSLNSSAMHGEAKCSLACIYLTTVLLIGTIIYRFWKGGWWVDSATAIILGIFFVKECIDMIRWGLSKDFSGGCCNTCADKDTSEITSCEAV